MKVASIILIAALILFGSDYHLTRGKYFAATVLMLKQIGHSFGFRT